MHAHSSCAGANRPSVWVGRQVTCSAWPECRIVLRPPTKGYPGYDQAGLVWLLRGRPVVALTATSAVIQGKIGSLTTFRRAAL